MMTMRQMMIFTAVARHGSFRSCAEHLGLSQVVVSTHIRELERRLGVTLFERRAGMPAVLTTKGQHAYTRIAGILADLVDLSQELAGSQTKRSLTLTTYGFIMLKLQDDLDRFRADHPHVELQIDLDPPDNTALVGQVQHGDVDLACFFSTGEANDPGSKLVGSEKLCIYVGHGHPLAGKTAVSAEQISGMAAVMLRRDNPQRLLTERILLQAGIVPGNLLLETDALGLMLHNVRRNQAWICMFRDSIDDGVEGLERVDLATPLPAAQIRLFSRASARHDPNMRALQACFLSSCA